MAIHVQRHTNVSKQATLLDELDVSPLKWRVCGCDLNRFVHEGMNYISNVNVHLKTCSGNVNISIWFFILLSLLMINNIKPQYAVRKIYCDPFSQVMGRCPYTRQL